MVQTRDVESEVFLVELIRFFLGFFFGSWFLCLFWFLVSCFSLGECSTRLETSSEIETRDFIRVPHFP